MNIPAINYWSLPISEPIELAAGIWGSIADETSEAVQLSQAQRSELHRKLAAHRDDPFTSIPWDQVRANLFNS
jgi:putative addiction module component (TIGR02574 family)